MQMKHKQTCCALAVGLCVLVLLYIVPPITEALPLAGAALGAVMLAIMAVCVFKGGLTDVSGE